MFPSVRGAYHEYSRFPELFFPDSSLCGKRYDLLANLEVEGEGPAAESKEDDEDEDDSPLDAFLLRFTFVAFLFDEPVSFCGNGTQVLWGMILRSTKLSSKPHTHTLHLAHSLSIMLCPDYSGRRLNAYVYILILS